MDLCYSNDPQHTYLVKKHLFLKNVHSLEVFFTGLKLAFGIDGC